jgi:hypothetical protein
MAHPRERGRSELRPERDALLVLRRIADAVIAVIHETPDGAPGGHLYAALMQHMTIDQFETLMNVLVEAGRITKRGNCYYPC